MKRFLILALLGLNFSSLAFADPVNTVTLTSYYPAPFGAYDRMRLVPRAPLGAGTCTAANEGTLYIPDSTFAINQCRAGTWVPIGDGLWRVERTSANARFDSIADIDQYFLRNFGSYWDVDILQPYVGIGTDDPTAYLHIFRGANDPTPGVSPTFIRVQNQSGVLNPGVGPGGKIAFAGAGGDNVVLRALFTKISAPRASSLGIFLRDGSDPNLIEQFRILGNGYLGIRDTDPSAILELAGNAVYPPAAPDNNSLPYLMISSNNVAARNGDVLTILPNGNVGINMLLPTVPTEKLDVNGNIRATALILTSDAALKKDIAPVENALDKISRLNGVSFEWKDNAQPTDHRKHIGVLAQEVEKIFPESVYGQEGAKGVDYPSLIAPLIEAVKELKNQNQAMDQQLKAQSQQIHEQQQQIESLKNSLAIKEPVLTP